MLGITSALAAEFATGVGLREQWLKAPAPILFSFAFIAIASYIPILKGFTRYAQFLLHLLSVLPPGQYICMSLLHVAACTVSRCSTACVYC